MRKKSEEPGASLRKSLSREAQDQLKAFDIELGRLKGRAFLTKEPQVEVFDSGNWLIGNEYAPEAPQFNASCMPRFTPLGKSRHRFIDRTFRDSERLSENQTAAGELFARRSKDVGVSQLVGYRLKHDALAVGYYTVVCTHGDTWTLT